MQAAAFCCVLESCAPHAERLQHFWDCLVQQKAPLRFCSDLYITFRSVQLHVNYTRRSVFLGGNDNTLHPMPHKPDPFRSAALIAFSMRNGKGLVCATIAFLTLVLRRKLSAFVKLFLPPLPFLTLLRMSIKCKQLCMNEKKNLQYAR